jgi:hypothetical protein
MNLNDIIIGVDNRINSQNKFGKMKHIKAYYQILHETKELNGFKWFGYCENSKGEYLHHFQKQDGKKWLEIKASEEDLENGNIEFMTLHHLSK